MKIIKGFQYHKSFYAVELEKKEFAIITDRAFLPTSGATYNLSVVKELQAIPMDKGWLLTLKFLCGHRQEDIGIYHGTKAELAEFLLRANALIEAMHTRLP